MGAMFYGAYRDDPSKATTQSEQPSLDEVASALIGPDLLRAFGAKLERGRGEALERSWAARLPDPEHPLTLAAWADRTGRFVHGSEDPFPAFLFDATIVETGQAMAFTTTQFPSPGYRSAFDRRSRQSPIAESANLVFDLSDGDASMGGGADLQVATAARLSAAFPFVSPAATLQTAQGKRFHVVDGGYYDNYGLVVTSQWLDDALEEISKGGRFDVAMALDLVIARTLVDATQDVVAPIDAQKPEGPWRYTASAKSHGWAWQATAPVLAFVNGRTFGQWTGGNQVLRLLIDKWRWRNATIRVHLFDLPARQLRLPCRVEPLSWKLTEPQRACMSEGWEKVKTKVAALQR